MSRFKKKRSEGAPAISTASLPDIVFMLLFFFMTVTTMREVTPLVRQQMPDATEVAKLEKKSAVAYIYIGPPTEGKLAKLGSAPRIQLDDSYAEVKEIGPWVVKVRESKKEEDKPLLTMSLKVDKETNMGIVTDVKQELRKAGAFKINYSSRKESRKK
jgi:biopolymer transport protein ExbD